MTIINSEDLIFSSYWNLKNISNIKIMKKIIPSFLVILASLFISIFVIFLWDFIPLKYWIFYRAFCFFLWNLFFCLLFFSYFKVTKIFILYLLLFSFIYMFAIFFLETLYYISFEKNCNTRIYEKIIKLKK